MTVVAHDEAQSLKARIFSAAIAVFAEHGLSGARMEQIATEAQTTKRMVVYCFKSKEQLYQEVLQYVYARIRETEQQLGLENVPPVEALVRRSRPRAPGPPPRNPQKPTSSPPVRCRPPPVRNRPIPNRSEPDRSTARRWPRSGCCRGSRWSSTCRPPSLTQRSKW